MMKSWSLLHVPNIRHSLWMTLGHYTPRNKEGVHVYWNRIVHLTICPWMQSCPDNSYNDRPISMKLGTYGMYHWNCAPGYYFFIPTPFNGVMALCLKKLPVLLVNYSTNFNEILHILFMPCELLCTFKLFFVLTASKNISNFQNVILHYVSSTLFYEKGSFCKQWPDAVSFLLNSWIRLWHFQTKLYISTH